MAATPSPHPLAEGILLSERRVNGVRCIIATPEGGAIGDMIYFHGGGYRFGGPDRMTGFLTEIASKAHCRVIAPAYSLAPDNPYPAALHDAAAVIEGVTDEHSGMPLIIGGDSAGGGLAAASCIAWGEALPTLQGAVLISPWLDLRICAETFDRCAKSDLLFSHHAAQDAAEGYLQGIPATRPLASPLLADVLDGVPSTLIIVGSAEVLLQDSLDFAAHLAAQHIGVQLIVVPHMQHVSPAIFPAKPSTAFGIAAIASFMRDRLANSGLMADPLEIR